MFSRSLVSSTTLLYITTISSKSTINISALKVLRWCDLCGLACLTTGFVVTASHPISAW